MCHLRDKLDAVEVFESYLSGGFAEYLAASGSYFLMCHDGAFPECEMKKKADAVLDYNDNTDVDDESACESTEYSAEESWADESEEGSEEEEEEGSDSDGGSEQGLFEATEHNVGFRSMINWFVSRGYNIALINDLECRDTKVRELTCVDGTWG